MQASRHAKRSTGHAGIRETLGGRFTAEASHSGTRKRLGTFDTVAEARAAVAKFKRSHGCA